MKRCGLALIAPFCLLLTSCTYVACKEPVGTPIKDGLAEKIDGTWQFGNDAVHIKTLGDGKVRVSSIRQDKTEVTLKQDTIVVTTIGEGMYANWPVVIKDHAMSPQYMPLYMTVGDRALVLYHPQYEVFAEAVRSGKLKGAIKENKPTALGDPAAKDVTEPEGVSINDAKALEEFIRQRPMSDLFNVNKPLGATRIGEETTKMKDKGK